MAKPILLAVHVDGAQKLLRSVFAINKLPFGDGTGVEDPVAEEGERLVRKLWAAGGGGEGLRGEGRLVAQSWEGASFMHFLPCPGPWAGEPCQDPGQSFCDGPGEKGLALP